MRILDYWNQLCSPRGHFQLVITRLKSRRKCPNFGLQGLVIDGLLAGLKSRRKYANFGLKWSSGELKRHFQLVISRHKKSQKLSEFCPTGISNYGIWRCIPRGHFQLVIRRHKKSQKISEFWPTENSYWKAISRLKKSRKMCQFWPTAISYWWVISRLRKSQKMCEFWPIWISYCEGEKMYFQGKFSTGYKQA